MQEISGLIPRTGCLCCMPHLIVDIPTKLCTVINTDSFTLGTTHKMQRSADRSPWKVFLGEKNQQVSASSQKWQWYSFFSRWKSECIISENRFSPIFSKPFMILDPMTYSNHQYSQYFAFQNQKKIIATIHVFLLFDQKDATQNQFPIKTCRFVWDQQYLNSTC